MSLNWNLSKIENHEALCFEVATEDSPMRGRKAGESYLKPETDVLIWACMMVGLRGITATNWPTFWARIALWEKLYGSLLSGWDTDKGTRIDYPMTAELVRAHIGLSTNVGDVTDAKWRSTTIKNWERSFIADTARKGAGLPKEEAA